MAEEEAKRAAQANAEPVSPALDPQRQSYSEGFMKSIDRKALASQLPLIAAEENKAAAADNSNPLDELDV